MKKFVKSKNFILLVVLICIIVFFAVISGGKSLGLMNIRSIFKQILISALLAIGAAYLMISGDLDLSCGAVGTFCGMLMAIMIKKAIPWPIAVLTALAIGFIYGLVNGLLINKLKFQGFIATMAVSFFAEGMTYVISKAKAVTFDNDTLSLIVNGKFLNNTVPYSVVGVLILFFIYSIVLSRSKLGREIYMIGGNPKAAYLTGINPRTMSYILFINSAVLSALAGCLFTAQMKSGTLTGILSSQMSGITAVMLGGISFGGGSGSMGSAFIGLLILNVFSNGLTVCGVNPYWKTFASGMLLLVALALDSLTVRRRNASRK